LEVIHEFEAGVKLFQTFDQCRMIIDNSPSYKVWIRRAKKDIRGPRLELKW
jgi:hypothetical protein